MFKRFLIVLATLAVAFGLRIDMPKVTKWVTSAVTGFVAISSFNPDASNALTRDQLQSLSYLQVKGTGLANRCPDVEGEGSINIQAGKKYKVTDFCIEPKNFQVEEEIGIRKGELVKEFVDTKLMTRQTYTLDKIIGDLEVKDGKAVFTEKDGIDFAATTVQLPGKERVPFLFTVKDLVATGNSAGPIKPGFQLSGGFTVPSYRTGLFLDPKTRGVTTGYDFAAALYALQAGEEGDKKLFKENNKVFDVLKGNVEFAVTKVNAEDGEFGGVFVSNQPSDTDMGAKAPKNILIKGIFSGKLEQ
mmetsp:Transcript_18376/g.19968  ORF Transcript_18376/g.19968 Transcript_18376/m.19968 type:complete len:302 (-) Transcript_18376:185-1090(-)|eukprot:gene15553-17434_t